MNLLSHALRKEEQEADLDTYAELLGTSVGGLVVSVPV